MRRVPIAIAVSCVLLAAGCSDTCGNSILTSLPSPDGRWNAVLFQRDCGATTGFSSHVSIVERDASLHDSGNAFIADTDHGIARAGSWGGPLVELKWLSPGHLLVRYAAQSQIFKRNEGISGVRISYEAASLL